MLKDKLTLLMPTSIDRLPCFRANLRHLEEEGFDGRLMVLDWGSKRLDEMGLWSADAPYSVDYRYYGPQMPFHERMRDGAARADTPYVLICPDDDFFFIETLNACVGFLEANRDFSAAQGVIYRARVIRRRGEEKLQFAALPEAVVECRQPAPLERLHFLARNYSHWIYCVQRKETLLERLECGARFADNLAFAEYYDTLFTVIKGKTHLIPSIGVVLSFPDTFASGAQSRSYDCFPFALHDPAFSGKYAQFRDELGGALAASGQAVDDASREMFDDAALGVMIWALFESRHNESESMLAAYSGLVADLVKRGDESAKLMKVGKLMKEAELIHHEEPTSADGSSGPAR